MLYKLTKISPRAYRWSKRRRKLIHMYMYVIRELYKVKVVQINDYK